jgi:hypothetical protein
MSNRALALAVPVAFSILVAACGGASAPLAASPSPSDPAAPGTQSAGPSTTSPSTAPSIDPETVAHAAGPTDVVLRVTETGGFVPIEYAMARVPLFTLYGDGRVIVVPDAAAKAQAGAGEPPTIRETRLSEPEIQAVLRYALTDGGMGVAKARYDAMVMDLPTTLIELDVAGASKTVEVGGLAAEPQPGPDAPALKALAAMVAQLRAIATDRTYEPVRSMAILAETEPGQAGARSPWPWASLDPSDFVQPGDADPIPFPKRLLTEAEAEALAMETATSSAVANLDGPDSRTYQVVLRPALPEEIDAG